MLSWSNSFELFLQHKVFTLPWYSLYMVHPGHKNFDQLDSKEAGRKTIWISMLLNYKYKTENLKGTKVRYPESDCKLCSITSIYNPPQLHTLKLSLDNGDFFWAVFRNEGCNITCWSKKNWYVKLILT